MKKKIVIPTLLVLSTVVFTGCTLKGGDSASTLNPSVNIGEEGTMNNEVVDVPELEQGDTIDELQNDLDNTEFDNIDIEIDSSL